MRTLSRRELNRALLARQLLLERGRMPLERAVEQVAGIQAQYAPSTYIGLWSRLEGFERPALDDALQRRAVVQGTLMRFTIHLVSREDYWPLALAVRDARRTWWRRVRPDPPAPRAMAGAARTLRNRLDGGSLQRKEIEALLGKARADGVGLWLDFVRVPPSGTWARRRADLYAAAADWIGEPPATSVAAATELLVRRYLGAFGPASRKDIASFTGLQQTPLRPVLARLDLRRFASESGEELLDLPDAPLPDPQTPAPPRFLPTFDPSLLVHARRTGVLPEEYRPRIFSVRKPHSDPTFLVDGAVRGTWRHEDGRIALHPFAPLDRATRRAVEDEAERLAAFHA